MAASATGNDGDFKQQTAHLAYTPDFNTRLEAVMDDQLATIGERYKAWLARNCWGGILYAVKEDGTPDGNVMQLKILASRNSDFRGHPIPRQSRILARRVENTVSCHFSSTLDQPQKVRDTPDFFKLPFRLESN